MNIYYPHKDCAYVFVDGKWERKQADRLSCNILTTLILAFNIDYMASDDDINRATTMLISEHVLVEQFGITIPHIVAVQKRKTKKIGKV